ncbi:FadR/GntR family transcriptional regulator [Streptomyces sp. NPDC058001]|uniref:FadR/GntR family transcriptional regulator n=1 Tax=Streptomyces sp. NPDC058001 TaxID=3346300 RepID=UPI0036E5B333
MAEIVAAELRHKILGGELQPGDSLSSESSLVEEYDVSRPTLREALRLLESQQLITVRRGSHRGPVVSHPDTSVTARSISMLLQLREGTLADIYAFRMLFEPVAVRMVTETATDDDLARLRALLEEEYEVRGDADRFPEAAWRFHTTLVALSGNVTMTVIAETLEHISKRHAQAALLRWADGDRQRDSAYRAHKKLVGLMEKGSGDEAEQFWAKHMAEVGKKLLSSTDELSIVELVE